VKTTLAQQSVTPRVLSAKTQSKKGCKTDMAVTKYHVDLSFSGLFAQT
jgi:hypothetical protein